jgi:outer membrane protein assembly factor BamE
VRRAAGRGTFEYDRAPLSRSHRSSATCTDSPMTKQRISYLPSCIRWLAVASIAAQLMLSGCVHRVPVPQGNFLKKDDLDKISVGMTRVQVRAVLGTPMIADPFENTRWDYVFYIKQGDRYTYKQQHAIVYFDATEKVQRIDRPELKNDIALPKVEELPPPKATDRG